MSEYDISARRTSHRLSVACAGLGRQVQLTYMPQERPEGTSHHLLAGQQITRFYRSSFFWPLFSPGQ